MSDPDSFKSEKKLIVITVLISLSISLVLAELVLSYLQKNTMPQENMDPGMVLYDAQLGWKLKPFWSGDHQHTDYDVSYKINSEGFRGRASTGSHDGYSIIGDSFSFGLGVNDDETFTALLAGINENSHFYNFSVPGYSTDQQLILIGRQKSVISRKVILVVYLGNDLFDNMRVFPLQAEHGKPYFKLNKKSLELKNTPVPLLAKSAAARSESISDIVLGEDSRSVGITGWLANLAISRQLGLFQSNVVLSDEAIQARFSDELVLFYSLLEAMQQVLVEKDASLNVVLLPGRSYVEQPDSLSAQYQEYFREQIYARLLTTEEITVWDLASYLAKLSDSGIDKLYYPNDGHLTALGHKYVADFLSKMINTNAISE